MASPSQLRACPIQLCTHTYTYAHAPRCQNTRTHAYTYTFKDTCPFIYEYILLHTYTYQPVVCERERERQKLRQHDADEVYLCICIHRLGWTCICVCVYIFIGLKASQPSPAIHCALSPVPAGNPLRIVLCPSTMEQQPCLLWSGEDLGPGDGNYAYVPTQLYPRIQREDEPHDLPELALRRLRMLSAVDHNNTMLGNIYISNCVEPMGWAGDHVGYIIDASNGRSKLISNHNSLLPLPHGACPLSHFSSQ